MNIRGKRGRRKILFKLSVLFRESSLARPSTSNTSKKAPAGFLNSLNSLQTCSLIQPLSSSIIGRRDSYGTPSYCCDRDLCNSKSQIPNHSRLIIRVANCNNTEDYRTISLFSIAYTFMWWKKRRWSEWISYKRQMILLQNALALCITFYYRRTVINNHRKDTGSLRWPEPCLLQFHFRSWHHLLRSRPVR